MPPSFDRGVHLHPSDAGYHRIGNAVDAHQVMMVAGLAGRIAVAAFADAILGPPRSLSRLPQVNRHIPVCQKSGADRGLP